MFATHLQAVLGALAREISQTMPNQTLTLALCNSTIGAYSLTIRNFDREIRNPGNISAGSRLIGSRGLEEGG